MKPQPLKLDDEQQAAAEELFHAPLDRPLAPHEFFQAIGLAKGVGEHRNYEEPTQFENFIGSLGFETDRVKQHRQLYEIQQKLMPLYEKFSEEKFKHDLATAPLRSMNIGQANKMFGIQPENAQLMETQAPMIGPMPGVPTPRYLDQVAGHGAQDMIAQKDPLFFEEAPRPMVRSQGMNPDAALLPFQQQIVGQIMHQPGVMQNGQYMPTTLARQEGDMLPAELANKEIENTRQSLLNAGLNPNEAPQLTPFPEGMRVPRQAVESQLNRATQIAKPRLETIGQSIKTEHEKRVTSAVNEFLALPSNKQTSQNASRAGAKYGVNGGDVLAASKDPNRPGVQVNVGDKAEGAFSTKFNEKMAEDTYKLYEHASKAQDDYDRMARITDMLKNSNVITGTAADFRLQMAKAFKALGLSDSDAPENTEILFTDLADNVLSAVKASGLGAGNGFTDTDRRYLEQAKAGRISLEKESMMKVAQIGMNVQKLITKKWNARVKQLPESAFASGLTREPIQLQERPIRTAPTGKKADEFLKSLPKLGK